jgi:hypothetical protein
MKRFKFSLYLFILIVFFFTFTLPGFSLWNYKDLRNAVVQIYRPDSNAGTGFIVKRGDQNFLITNAHMLNGVDHITVVAYVAKEGQPEPGQSKCDIQLIDKNSTYLWKSKPNIDIGIVPIPVQEQFIIKSRVTTANLLQASASPFDYSVLATDSIIISEHIEPGNIVRALGFPNALSYGEIENYPILLAGNLSTDIVNDTINSPTFGQKKYTFIVNFFGSKGSSGSPVLSSGEDRMLNQPGAVISINPRNIRTTYVIGVIYTGPEINVDYGSLPVLIESTTGQRDLYRPPENTTAHLTVPIVTPNIGMSYVIPAKYIRELIDLFP